MATIWDKHLANLNRIYEGVWSEKAFPALLDQCMQPVMPADAYHFSQCKRKPGHGFRGRYCKQHAKRMPAEVSQ